MPRFQEPKLLNCKGVIKVVSFQITAAELYSFSKDAFYKIIPNCTVKFAREYSQMFGYSSMSFDMGAVAINQKKTKRREITALVIAYCPDEHLDCFSQWLSDYFSKSMQKDIFDLTVDENGKIVPEKGLEKALNKLRKR